MPRRPHIGFTLVELIVSLVVLAVVLGLALPNFSSGFGGFQLQHCADDLKTGARWAQAMAMGQRRVYVLNFAADRKSYRIMRVAPESTEKEEKLEAVRSSAGRSSRIPSGVQVNVKEDRLRFYPDGTIDPAVIELVSGPKKLMLSSAAMRGQLVMIDE